MRDARATASTQQRARLACPAWRNHVRNLVQRVFRIHDHVGSGNCALGGLTLVVPADRGVDPVIGVAHRHGWLGDRFAAIGVRKNTRERPTTR